MEKSVGPFGSDRMLRRIIFSLFPLFIGLALILGGCGPGPRVFKKEFQLKGPLTVKPQIVSTGTAQAWEGCMAGRYFYPYTISQGVNASDVWLCCVPINALLSDSFDCGGVINLPHLGTPDDRKVQYCSLIDATSTEPHYIPACIPAPLSIVPSELKEPK